MEKVILDPTKMTDQEKIKVLKEAHEKSEEMHRAIKSGKKISEIAIEFGLKFVNPLSEEFIKRWERKREKRKETVIDIIKEMKTKMKYKR